MSKIATDKIQCYEKQMFKPGDRFQHINQGTKANLYGTIRYLRDDEYEKNERMRNPLHYYYHVDFEDGSFETYLNQMFIIHVIDKDDIIKKTH